ncbi:squalene/phytoene synthase family protein [Streptomyces sp. NPDC053499]|uniref:squalene/phytoene synthase family protein n=1 Tax=Streptomyces sp. NPDC053499 TaxID=3365707 RepID=UPI0037D0FD53
MPDLTLEQFTFWQRTLRRAGVPEGALRSDYTAALRLTTGRYPAMYPLARSGCPSALQPHVVAVAAFGIHADCLVDVPVNECDPGPFHAWAVQVRQGLLTGRSEQPFLRAFLRTVSACSVSHADVHAYLAGQAGRLGLSGYATEQDHYDNIDHSNMPFARVLATSCGIPTHPRNESVVRLAVDAIQRWDDLADLADDLRRGLLTIPETELLRFHATRDDLESGRDTPAVRALLTHTCGKARAVLHAAYNALDDADPLLQLSLRPSLMICFQAMGGLERAGAALLRPSPLWHFRPTATHLLDGTLRTLHHRLSLAGPTTAL